MKTWTEFMNHIAAGLLFQGGYLATPTRRVLERSARVGFDARHGPAGAVARGEIHAGDRPRSDACRPSPRLEPS